MSKIRWKKTAPLIVWNKIKSLRIEKKLTQVQVSAFADVSVATIWMIEQGYDKTTSKKTKQRLATFFNCDIEDIFPCEMIGNQTREEYLKGLQKD